MSEIERRFTPVNVEVRVAAEEKRTIGGYTAKFNRLSRNLGGFVERLAPTAFNRSRGNDWMQSEGGGVIARYNHDDNMLLGTTAARTLRLSTDDVGLVYDVDLPAARSDVYELVQRGDVTQSSFAFRVIGDEEEWELSDQGYPQRTLHSLELVDVAPVNTPAYLDTTAAIRSLAKQFDAPEDEVRRLAHENQLRKFFVRSNVDGPVVVERKPKLGAAARMELLSKQQDPFV